ncbi:YqiA/YcfP family alpha/beta fold hydrolase [Oceanospirillum sediminis]|uniref:Alpha/beta fold hydrolase n=1 Tax=Oceanospirillum sediminis TaxID=2760088 RepID=A0A839IIY6_9GAMM|nr:alpha/beta fold hydrolase [Oceanospirillum sediminis]
MEQHLIYIHGFNSSPFSWKARLLAESIRINKLQVHFHCPELSHWPDQAMQTLTELINTLQGNITLIGSSLGGFYSTALLKHYAGIKAILINPAVAPHTLLADYLGPNQNMYTGQKYELTQQHMQQLLHYYLPDPVNTQDIKVFLQTEDETLDYRQALHYYRSCELDIEPGGNHGYEGFERRLKDIYQYAGLQLPDPLIQPQLQEEK